MYDTAVNDENNVTATSARKKFMNDGCPILDSLEKSIYLLLATLERPAQFGGGITFHLPCHVLNPLLLLLLILNLWMIMLILSIIMILKIIIIAIILKYYHPY